MVTDPDSSSGPQRAGPAAGTGVSSEGERRPRSEQFWSWLRVIVLLLVAIGLGVWGYLLRPIPVKPLSVSVPTITILANQQDVTATIDMTLLSELGQKKPYTLTLTITPTNPSQSVEFAVSFGGFPASGTGPNLHTSQNAYYTVINSTPGLSGTASQSRPWTFSASQPIGEKSQGAQLRVAFPNLVGEEPGSQSSQVCTFAASLVGYYSTICRQLRQLGNQPQWATPLLEAGTTAFSSTDPALGDYEFLAGDNPTLLGTTT